MNKRYLIATLFSAAAVAAGCDRNTEVAGYQPPVAEAERAVEKAGSTLDDAAITAKVKTALIAEPGLKGMSIDVDTAQNVVTLTGVVGSDALKQEAERLAKQVDGVKAVTNNLDVKAQS